MSLTLVLKKSLFIFFKHKEGGGCHLKKCGKFHTFFANICENCHYCDKLLFHNSFNRLASNFLHRMLLLKKCNVHCDKYIMKNNLEKKILGKQLYLLSIL